MQTPLQISFHNLAPSEPMAEFIRAKAAKLEERYPRLIGCVVTVEEPNHHHKQGKGKHFRVRVDLLVPGATLVSNRDAPVSLTHEDAYLAITATFEAARRQLATYTRRQEGETKPPHPAKRRGHPRVDY